MYRSEMKAGVCVSQASSIKRCRAGPVSRSASAQAKIRFLGGLVRLKVVIDADVTFTKRANERTECFRSTRMRSR